MIIEFETDKIVYDNFPNKNDKDARWYTAAQPALMFLDGSKYPDKFDLGLAFSSSPSEVKSVAPFAIGRYELDESAFGFDNRRNPVVDFTKLKLTKKTA